jgi:hypothetical protein
VNRLFKLNFDKFPSYSRTMVVSSASLASSVMGDTLTKCFRCSNSLTLRIRSLRRKIIFSPRKAKRERLDPTNKTTKAPVKFLIERGDSFFFCPLWGFPVHWGGIGRNHVSQKSTSPVSCRFNVLFRCDNLNEIKSQRLMASNFIFQQ